MIYNIGSINVHNLNYPGSKDSKRSFETIATIIKREAFAVVALQEVLSDKVWGQLKMHLGNQWEFAWEQPAPRYAGAKADKRGEGYAYIWDTTKLDLVEIDVDDEIRRSMPRIWKQYQGHKTNSLAREPYYARFTPIGKISGCFFELRLINTHIVYGDSSTEGIKLRRAEFLKLVKNIYENIANKRYGNNMPAYVVVLGDYKRAERLPRLLAKDTYSLARFHSRGKAGIRHSFFGQLFSDRPVIRIERKVALPHVVKFLFGTRGHKYLALPYLGKLDFFTEGITHGAPFGQIKAKALSAVEGLPDGKIFRSAYEDTAVPLGYPYHSLSPFFGFSSFRRLSPDKNLIALSTLSFEFPQGSFS